MSKKKRSPHTLHDYLFPHRGNDYKPHIFRTASITAIVIGILVLQGVYITHIKLVLPKTDFLASVLPGTLAALTNTDRAQNNVPTLVEDAALAEAAQMKADDMAAKGYFSHVSPDGTEPWRWMDRAGYQYAYAGENLAVNFTDSEEVESAWMKSPTHRANIVKREYTRVGIGVANGVYEGREATFVVQFFATPPASPTFAKAAIEPATPHTVPSAAVPAPRTEPETVATVPLDTQVLGVETSIEDAPPSAAATLMATAATSPTQTMVYALSALAAIFLVLLSIAISAKARVQYLEVIGGGLLLLALLAGLVYFNTRNEPQIEVPLEGEAATTPLDN